MRKVIAYGGGLDSFAMLLSAIERGELPEACVFADVADPDHLDPGEWPGTYRHIREVVQPLCVAHGIEFVWLDTASYPVRDARSLFAWLEARHQIPVTGPTRICTIVAKVERFERWMDDRFPGEDVEVWVGFDAAEEGRAANDPNAGKKRKMKPGQARRRNRFPLIEEGLCRCRCEALARRLGFPVPRKSACCYCPYGSKGDWQTLERRLPDYFALAEKLQADKPPTAAGKKLSIMGYKKLRNGGYRAPTLRQFIQGAYRPRRIACPVCGAPERASKVAGCGYLDEAA